VKAAPVCREIPGLMGAQASTRFRRVLRDTYAKIFRRALEIVGDEEALAREIGARPHELKTWLSGMVQPPSDKFLRAVDIILERNGPPAPELFLGGRRASS
jgi:hypothetical protein